MSAPEARARTVATTARLAALCLCPPALALSACRVEHSAGELNYMALFRVEDTGESALGFSLELAGNGRAGDLRDLAVNCDGTSMASNGSDDGDPTSKVFFSGRLARRAAGESHACVLTWSGGERTFLLPSFGPPSFDAPADGASLRVSEPIEFVWGAAAPPAGGYSGVSLSIFGECVTEIQPSSGLYEPDDGAQSLAAGSLELSTSPCQATAYLEQYAGLVPPSEGAFNLDLGFEDVRYSFISRRLHNITLLPLHATGGVRARSSSRTAFVRGDERSFGRRGAARRLRVKLLC